MKENIKEEIKRYLKRINELQEERLNQLFTIKDKELFIKGISEFISFNVYDNDSILELDEKNRLIYICCCLYEDYKYCDNLYYFYHSKEGEYRKILVDYLKEIKSYKLAIIINNINYLIEHCGLNSLLEHKTFLEKNYPNHKEIFDSFEELLYQYIHINKDVLIKIK